MTMAVKMPKARIRSQKRHTNRCGSNKTQKFQGRSMTRTGGSKAKNHCPNPKPFPFSVVKAKFSALGWAAFILA